MPGHLVASFRKGIQPPYVTLSEAKGLKKSDEILPLHGARPERDSSVAEFMLRQAEVLPQNDRKRRIQGQNDNKQRVQGQDDRKRMAQSG